MGHVAQDESGIYGPHVAQIEAVAKASNCFIFIRPSTKETAALIGLGLPTKSVDVHDKSSDWGPMAGLVPCNGVFSKKGLGALNPEEVAQAPHEASTSEQLVVPDELWSGFTAARLNRVTAGLPGDIAADEEVYTATSGKGPARNVKFLVKRGPGGRAVWWLHELSPAEWRRVVLYVWCYEVEGRKKPVTGDYDLWMIAPHASKSGTRDLSILEDACMRGEIHQGLTQAPPFVLALIKSLNEKCGRTANPVFNHGAEAQNVLFTQPIDATLAMFTPSGTSRMVNSEQVPTILSECQSRGYFVFTNRTYQGATPDICGQTVEEFRAKLGAELARFDRLQDLAGAVAQRTADTHAMAEFGRKLNAEFARINTRTNLAQLRESELPEAQRKPAAARTASIVRLLASVVSNSTSPSGVSTDAIKQWERDAPTYFVELAGALGFFRSSAHFATAWAQLPAAPAVRTGFKPTTTAPRGAGFLPPMRSSAPAPAPAQAAPRQAVPGRGAARPIRWWA